MLRPKKQGGSFGFQCMVANICGADAATVSWERRENLGAFPPSPVLEGVLASETRDLGITMGWDFWREVADGVIRSITSLSEVSGPDFIGFCKIGLLSNFARLAANF